MDPKKLEKLSWDVPSEYVFLFYFFGHLSPNSAMLETWLGFCKGSPKGATNICDLVEGSAKGETFLSYFVEAQVRENKYEK